MERLEENKMKNREMAYWTEGLIELQLEPITLAGCELNFRYLKNVEEIKTFRKNPAYIGKSELKSYLY